VNFRARPSALLVGLIGAIIALAVAHGRVSPYNNYVLFAQALLHGQLYIDSMWPGASIDAVLWNGHRYIVNDPVPGVLMLPLVAAFGLYANETMVSCLMCGVAIGAAWALLTRLGVATAASWWLVAFALCGTDLLWCSMLGDVWFMAQTCAVAFGMLALVELAGARRGWLVALWTSLAIGSRFTEIMAVPVILFWIFDGFRERERRPREAIAALITFVPFGIIWIAYNLARWNVPWDAGHTIFYHQDPYLGDPYGSPFGIGNIPMQLWYFFVQLPDFQRTFPWVIPEFAGTALTYTSPALLLAAFARRPRRLVITLWIATLLVAIPSLLYYVAGGSQFGMRHALDVLPFLIALMALAASEGLAVIWRALIVWSVAVGAYGIWIWNHYVRPGM
jgi:hypothetical protein